MTDTRITPADAGTFLDRIVAHKRREVAERRARRPFAEVERAARAQPLALDFAAALAAPGMRLIAEIKGRSPSKGVLIDPFDPPAIAADYLAAGADAISVLTDEAFFGGSLDHLSAVKALSLADARPRPILRKDFLLDRYQVAEARAAGADAILLIVAMLDDDTLRDLQAAAAAWGMAALVEVHDEREAERAVAAGARLVGINNRDLHSFRVDLAVAERLAPRLPVGTLVVGESGIATVADVRRLARAGVAAILVGESLVKSADRRAAIGTLLGRGHGGKERPPLTARTPVTDFQAFYWRKGELLAFCRAQGLRTAGTKGEIGARIAAFLGGEAPPAPRPRARSRPMPGAFERDTMIGPGWRCSEPLRAFFRDAIGPRFHFDRAMREFITQGQGKTLGEAIDAWHAADRAPRRQTAIEPQFEYNRFTRDYFAAHPGASRGEAIAAWNEYKTRRKTDGGTAGVER